MPKLRVGKRIHRIYKVTHGPHQCPIRCPTMVLYENLKKVFNNDNNNPTDKKNYFIEQSSQNENIFKNIFHLKKYDFIFIEV